MPALWFCLVAFMLVVYVVLDGFDLGAGIVHLFVARTDSERKEVLASIGPVWNGNEVWLLAAGGTLYFAFPALYASGFSAFYLPLMIVLWLLMLRGIAVEFRDHLHDRLWPAFWDVIFALSSLLLAIFFGAALGNVVRGLPLDEEGYGFLALWTNFAPGKDPGIIDWYTVLIGVAAALALTMHGAVWVAARSAGELRERCRRLGLRVWWAVFAITIVITFASFQVQPHLAERFLDQPWGGVFAVLALAGLAAVRFCSTKKRDTRSFIGSCAFLIGILGSAAFGLFPYVLPSNENTARSLTIYNTVAGDYGLKIGLMWFIPGVLLALGYFAFLYWHFWGRRSVTQPPLREA